MTKEPTAPRPNEPESPVDRFEHEIEELEKPLGHSLKQWVVGVLVALTLVVAFFVFAALQERRVDPSEPVIPIIEFMEPTRVLDERPDVFRWESLSGASRYVVRIMETGGAELIVRETNSNSVELTADERGRLVKGGSYTWKVTAHSKEGRAIGMGEAKFTL